MRRSRSQALRLGVLAAAVASLFVVVALGRGGEDAPATKATLGSFEGRSLPRPLRISRGRAYVVSTNGSDRNPGTRERPLRTVQAALDRVLPGQRVLIRRGRYSENLELIRSGTARAPITVRSYPGESAVLRPGSGARCSNVIELTNVAYVRVHGLRFEGAHGCDNNTNVYVAGRSRHIEVSGNEIRNGHDHGLYTDPGTDDVQVLGNRIHDNGTVGSGNKDHALYMEGTRHLVANNLIYNHPYGHAVQIYPSANGTIITNNTIVNTSYTSGYRAAGIIVGGDGLGLTADNILIVNNIVVWNNYGIYGYYEEGSGGPIGSGNVARRNLLYSNRFGDIRNDKPVIASTNNVTDRDPRFLDRAAADFRLARGSPAVGRALPQFAMKVDYLGHKRVGRPDLGAFELVRPAR